MKFSTNKIIQELLPEFIKSGLYDFDVRIEDIIRNKNTMELFRLAHSWKGAAAQYEFPDLAQKCTDLIELSQQVDWNKVSVLSKDIYDYIKEMEEHFDKFQIKHKKFKFYKS
jgi:HPt (histidine-containing phosphotransfer) domain-containing protein